MSSSTPYTVDDDELFGNHSEEPQASEDILEEQDKGMGKITNYNSVNFLGFVFACFSAISFAVFLTATQTYFITDVLGISGNLGSYVGTLGFYDELLAIILVPLIGTLSDRIGTRPIQVAAFAIIGLSFFGYAAFARSVYPGMLFWRLIFSFGGAGATSTMMVMLIELNNSNYKMTDIIKHIGRKFGREDLEPLNGEPEEEEENENEDATHEDVNKINAKKKEGKRTSVTGVASGLGAIFAVSVYLRLPVKYGADSPASTAMKKSYSTVGCIALITAVVLFFALYKDDKKRIFKDDIEELFEGLDEEGSVEKKENYLESMKHGATIAIKNPVILMSYLGSFMSRITTIVVAVFIPFYINNYFFKSGKCSTNESDNVHCRDSYVLASILSGISHTVALLAAPLVGILIDRVNNHAHLLLITNTLSLISAVGLSSISKPDESKMIFFWVSLLGLTQISFILVSMTMLSNINSKKKYYSYKGSISGVYSLFGGVGILIMNKLGGTFGDWFISGPFVMLALCNFIFFACMFALKGAKENDERSFKDVVDKFRAIIRRERN